MASFVCKNIDQKDILHYNEIGLCVQNTSIIIGSIIDMIAGSI